MIGTIRKHSTWMWVIIIAAIIITFVYWGAAPNRYDNARGGSGNFGSINGERISQKDFFNAQREVYLRYFFSYGDWPGPQAKEMGFDVERETYFRLLLIQKLKQQGIHVGMNAILRTRDEILRSIGRGNAIPVEVFAAQVLNRQGLSADDFRRFIEHDLGIQQLISAAGISGRLVTPQEARLLYEREHTDYLVEAVFFSGSNHLAEVTATPEEVAQFYTNQMARYRLPERVQVKYVEFPVTNYLAAAKKYFQSVTNFDEQVEGLSRALGTNYFKNATSPAEIKEKTRELMIKTNASALASAAANEFARGLFAIEPVRADNLDKFAKEKGLTVRVTQPFGRDYGPEDLAVRAEFTKKAFALSADDPLAGPLPGEDAAYIIALDKKLPSEIPPLEKIRDRVTAEYKFSQAVKIAVKEGEKFAATLTNGLAAGKKFSVVCNEAKVRPVTPPPFSLATRAVPEIEAHLSLDNFKEAVFRTPLGQASGFFPTREGGFVIFVREKLPLELAKLNADLPAFLNSIRQTRQNEAFNDWFRKEAEKGLRDTPVLRQQPQQPNAPKT